jgi:hypothetical protein
LASAWFPAGAGVCTGNGRGHICGHPAPAGQQRIFGIKQDGIQGAGDGEDPRQTNRPSDSRRSASWTIFASSVRGGIAALKLCASMAWLTAA